MRFSSDNDGRSDHEMPPPRQPIRQLVPAITQTQHVSPQGPQGSQPPLLGPQVQHVAAQGPQQPAHATHQSQIPDQRVQNDDNSANGAANPYQRLGQDYHTWVFDFTTRANQHDIRGSPHDEYTRRLWHEHFEAYKKVTLTEANQALRPPNGEFLQRFMITAARCAWPGPGAPTLSWLRNANRIVLEICIFLHKDFQLSDHERMHMDNTVAWMLKEGLVLQDDVPNGGQWQSTG
ncbi:hypothetical protein SLS60_006312 [Paraconiothyrium brasiliense]|uniref:Uncharacterized protein n=1 Tax=Paraconiothyrium brasiliense TaxID=300254 RepID=A0ABR3RAD2_9PLEO